MYIVTKLRRFGWGFDNPHVPWIANIAFVVFYRQRIVMLPQVVFRLKTVRIIAASAEPQPRDRVRVDPVIVFIMNRCFLHDHLVVAVYPGWDEVGLFGQAHAD